MKNDPNNDTERYQRRKNVLRQFYTADPNKPTPEELEWSTPILKSLKNKIKRYKELEPIATGGEKRIVRTFDQRLNRCVAMAYPIKTQTPEDFEQFLREAQLTANLMHPNIVPIYNMGIDDQDTPFFSMELISGDSLKDIIQKLSKGDKAYEKRYPLGTLLGIYNKVCDAVAYAHSCNVLHLDIKPDNIRVGQFGEVFLCDWGLAHVGLDEDNDPEIREFSGLDGEILNDMTLSGIMKGTPGFMAPEQITGGEKTPQTDIYALGAILYVILTNELPVIGSNTNEVVENTRNGKVIHPRIRHPGHPAPASLVAVAMKSLANDPGNRYPDVQNLQADINLFLSGYPTEAEEAGVLTRFIMFSQRHKRISFWVMTLLILLAIVMSINLTLIRNEKKIAEENLALYLREQEKAEQISEELASLSYYAHEVRSYASAKRMLAVMQNILDHGDVDSNMRHTILYEKGRMHFMLQQFNGASESLNQLPQRNPRTEALFQLCREYAKIKPDDNEMLASHNLAQLLTNTDAINRDFSIFLYFHYIRNQPKTKPDEQIEVVTTMLHWLNELDVNNIPELKLEKRPAGWHLDLSHTPYSDYLVTIPLIHRENILKSLGLYSLDISYTPLSLSRELKQMKLTELRMVGVALEPHSTLPANFKSIGLERLIIGKGDYPNTVIARLRRKGIEVVEEEYEKEP